MGQMSRFLRSSFYAVGLGLAAVVAGRAAAVRPAVEAACATVPPQADATLGRTVYEKNCLECHGARGKGDGSTARRLSLHPRDLALGVFKCHCSADGTLASDDDLKRVITKGMPGTPMVAHASLGDADLTALVGYVKALSPRFATAAAPRCEAPPAAAPSAPDLVAEGRHLYRLLRCTNCHGPAGKGNGPMAATLKDDWGSPIRPRDYTAGLFKCGNDDQDLFRTIQNGVGGTPMAPFRDAVLFAGDAFPAGTLADRGTPADVQALVAYLATQPTGAALAAMPEADRRALGARRTWALVRDVRSLVVR